ncbi:MAG: hypothetical protein J6N21_12595, partial [Butyrivibrio sp.]|nr:hypothetical protein [Butyrivibrio sp.]
FFKANYNHKEEVACIDYRLVKRLIQLIVKEGTADQYRINGMTIPEYLEDKEVKKYKSRIRKTSTMMAIVITIGKKNEQLFEIVGSKEDIDHSNRAYFYSEKLARDLITAAFAEGYKSIDDEMLENAQVKRVVYNEKEDGFRNSIAFPSKMVLRADGGMLVSQKEKDNELVESLMYSPYKGTFISMKVTYDKKHNYCYMDPVLFRKYVREQGNPGLSLSFARKGIDFQESFIDELNDESVLHSFGYNVSQNGGLSDDERHAILADILDLELMIPSKMITLIEFFYNSHNADKYELAKSKWLNDISFVRNYDVNPKRFIDKSSTD